MRTKGKTYCSALRTIETLNRLESQPDGIGLGALAREVGVSTKQVRRDVRVLQRAGRRVELLRGRKGTLAICVPPPDPFRDLLDMVQREIAPALARIFGAGVSDADPANGNTSRKAAGEAAA